MPKTANRISFLVDSQLPDFINEEYELFTKFIQKYYEQLEIQGQPYDIVENLATYRDIDFYEQNILKQHDNLDGSISNNATTIVLQDATSFPKQGGYVKINDEIIFYETRTNTTLQNCSRGISGNTTLGDIYNKSKFVTTQASSHTNGSKVLNISNLFLYALIKSFETEYLNDFPEAFLNDAVDKRTLIKNVSSFYQSKGTDKSIKFIFKCLIKDDPEPEIAYPRDFTLKSSESNWVNNYSLKVKVLSGTVTDLIGKTISQTTPFASAIVDNVRFNGTFDGEDLYEIILNEASVNGNFSIAARTKLTESILVTDTVGDRVDVESTMGWDKEGEFTIGNEVFTFEDKNVNQFVIKSRQGTTTYPIGTPVTFGANVSGANVSLLVYGVLYNAINKTDAPYSNVGDILEISEPGFVTNDIKIFDAQNNLRWTLPGASPLISDLNTNVSSIYEDGEGYYIASSGFPSHVIGTTNQPSDTKDQKQLKIIRKTPISTTETYETKFRDVGIAINGIPFASYKDESVVFNGALQSITVNLRGNGYKDAPFVLIDGVSGNATSSLSGQVLESITIRNAGSYNAIPTVEVLSGRNATATAIVTNGEITSISVTNAGEFYSTPPEVRITDSVGKGRFADYVATVSGSGAVTGFTKINGGNFYSQENVTVDLIPVGSGATATATIKEWRKDKYFINKNNVDSDNGYWFQNFNPSKGHGYAYYASPTTLRANDTGASHSPILGFAYDGNPIYGAYGFSNPLDSSSVVTQMSSSYFRNSTRVGPSTTTYPIGTFIDDYTFNDGSGTLDKNNGRFCVTPEYPEGTYAYFITVDSNGDPLFPYIIGKCYYSLPLESNYNSEMTQDDLPVNANRLRTSDISKNGVQAIAKIEDVTRGVVSSATIVNSGSNFSVGGSLVIDNSGTEGSNVAGEIDSVKGKPVSSLESQTTKVLYVELINNGYLFDGDTITQTNTGATGKVVGNVFTANRFALRAVTGTFNSTDVLSSNTKVLNLILDQQSSYTKGATLSFSDGIAAAVATGEVLETTVDQNTVKIKVLSGTFSVSTTLFLTSSNLINTTGSKIVSITSLSENLPVFKIQDNVALLTTSSAHGVGVGEEINVDVNPDDAVSTTTYYVRKRVYQEAILQTSVITTTLNDNSIGRFTILNGGGDYTQNTYLDIALSGGAGSGAKATIVVSSTGVVNSIILTNKGTGYNRFDILTVGATDLGKATNSSKPDLKVRVDHAGFAAENIVLNVDNSDNITVNDFLKIGSEIVKVTAKNNNALTVARAQNATTAVDHFDGATISVFEFGYNIPVNHPVGNTIKDAKVLSYDPSTQKAVFVWDYDQTVSSINKITLSTVFYDTSADVKLIQIKSVTNPDVYFEFSLDNTTFIRNQIIDIKNYYKYKFDTSHVSMNGVGFDISPSRNFNLVTPEKTVAANNSFVDIKLGFGSRVSTNTHGKKQPSLYTKYYYYDRDGLVNSEMSYLNVVTDPLQGIKNSLYVTSTQILYSTETQASHDGTGIVSYTSKSLFSVGKINSIKITNVGNNYKKIPIVTGIVDNDGNIDSNVSCFLNSTDIGVPRNIKIHNNGGSYHSDQTIKSSIRSNFILTLSNFTSDGYNVGETIVQKSGTTEVAKAKVTSWRKGSNILSVSNVTGIFRENQQIIGLSGNKTATVDSISFTEFTPIIKTFFDNIGKFTSDVGKLSDQNQKIHDSYFYQDFSYLIQSKTPIDSWRSLIKETTHPAGFKMFGEVDVESAATTPMSSDTVTTHNSFVELKTNITVQSTTKQITQHLISAQTTTIEDGVGSVAKDATNTTEIKSSQIKLSAPFDGSLSNNGNLAGTKTFGILDMNNNAVTPYNEQALLITLDGIFQEPGVAYTVSGSNITFAQPPLGPTNKNSQAVPGVRFYGKNYQFKNDTLNAKYLRKIKNIFQKSGRWIDAANQIERNRVYLQSETLGYIKNKFPNVTWGKVETKCYRDIGLVADALANDIRFGGNSYTVTAIEKYFNNDILDYIIGELQETTEAYEYLVGLAKLAINNTLPTGTYTTVPPYINTNIIVDPDPNKCADVVAALSTLGEVIEKTLAGGVGTIPISYPDYIDGKNTIFELYYEDGTGLSTDPNENLLIGISGVVQHDSAYSIDRTSVPNKVVFSSPPIWSQGVNTKTLQEGIAVDKFFAHSIGSYLRCEIDKNDIPTGSNGAFLILNSDDKKVINISDPQFALVFIDGVLQRDQDSYIINGPTITFSRKIFQDSNIEILYLYGRDISQSITLYDYERSEYYNEIIVRFTGVSGDFDEFENWWGKFNQTDMVAYQKVGGIKKFIGSLKHYYIEGNDLVIQIAGFNPDVDGSDIFFSGLDDFSDEISLSQSRTVTVTTNSDNTYRMQRNASRWLYGTKKADEAFYVRKNGFANLNKGDLIKINGENEYRTINELPQYFEPKTYLPGDDPSNSFFGSVATTNYNGEEKGIGFAVSCTISNGSVDTITWDKNIPVSGYSKAPILHFVPVNQAGGGARAEVIVVDGTIVDIVLTNGGSGYTKVPRVVVAKQYSIKKQNRKIDSFVNLILHNQFSSIAQPGPVNAESSVVFTKSGSGTTNPDAAIVGTMISPAAFGGTVITVELPSIALDQASTFIVRQELLYIRPPSTGTADVKTSDSNIKVRLELDRSIESQPVLSNQIWKVTVYQFGFTDYRFWSTPPSGFANTTLRPSFQMWENAKFMDTGNVLHNGVSVSAYTIEEFARWGFDLEDFSSYPGSGISDAGYAFNVGYPSINHYLGRINQNLNSTDTIVYVENTTNFSATGTLQLGKEQITYTGKQSDRFTGCVRGVNGTTAQSHDTSEPFFRSA
tara:strand:+ start:748 stop:9207 length:8460 start_codon:yes stop_codon:yes gene_type:complete